MLNLPPVQERDQMLLAIGLATGLATLFGGTLALRLKSWLGLLAGFGAGAVLGVSLFDLLPEALALGAGRWRPVELTTALACGFAGYLATDRFMASVGRGGGWRGHLGAAALTAHSLMDGLAIGLAFQVSSAVGVIVAVAVLAHDFLDGANTVTLALSGGAGGRSARVWLLIDAVAPLAGMGLARLVTVPQASLAMLLAVFAGFFLYIGASELLPGAIERRPSASTPAATLMGLLLIYAVVRLSGG